jgi:carbon-monoxide dehydrogenase large subunit
VARKVQRQLGRTGTNTTLCAHNPLGAKGCGEAGTIGAPPAIMNALLDALAPLGITDLDMPATPERVFRAIAQHHQA